MDRSHANYYAFDRKRLQVNQLPPFVDQFSVNIFVVNYYVLLIFAPLLVIIGVLGFLIPDRKSLTSGAATYNVFHIIFGLLGIAFVVSQNEFLIRSFNIGFGLIDLYQAVASKMKWFPKDQFRWKKADDILHVIIGLALVLVGMFAG